jgi:hypothetical protein
MRRRHQILDNLATGVGVDVSFLVTVQKDSQEAKLQIVRPLIKGPLSQKTARVKQLGLVSVCVIDCHVTVK